MKDNTKRPFDRLDEGKSWFMGLLNGKGFKDVTETSQFEHWDVIGTYAGKTYIFELKNRDFESTRFGDAALEEKKVKSLLDTPFVPVLVYFWTDRWTMIDLRNNPYQVMNRSHRATTRFSYDDDITTAWAYWPLDTLKMLDY